jgi:excinuclease ABC subunit C
MLPGGECESVLIGARMVAVGDTSVRASVSRLPTGPGVYRFVDGPGRALYVGRAVDLRRRVGSYWGELRGRRHLRRMMPRIAGIEAIACDSGHEAAWLERNVLECSKPPFNRIRGGLEVPLFIVVDRDPPKLRAVHDTGPSDRAFGPYLGGTRVRLAMSGLLRAFPLHYASTRLTGTERELASVRGFAAAARTDLIAGVTAVLGRDPLAVSALASDLSARRDAAAAAVAFELAARLQAEIEALAWITQEQKVFQAGGGDATAYGYADGLLLQLNVRAGRIDGWQTLPAQPETAAPLVATSPPQWRAFAQRNAHLAAALRTSSR